MKTFERHLQFTRIRLNALGCLIALASVAPLSACDVSTVQAVDAGTKTKSDDNEGGTKTGSGDDDTTGGDTPPVVDAAAKTRYNAVIKILQNHCTSCHTGMDSLTEADFQYGGYTQPGKPASSDLYTALKGADVAGARDMPRNGTALSASELAAIKSWIVQMKPVTDSGN